jgi:hypothetical protein
MILEVKLRRKPIIFSLIEPMKTFRFLICIVAGILLSTFSARANVYASDIEVNGSLGTITSAPLSPVTISYRLNQAATLGVTVAISQGTTPVATIRGGTNMGLNKVVWGATNSSGANLSTGTFSFTITAAASGFPNWQQISVDTNAGNYAYNPNGMAVDNNTNSPYYGRVVLGCSLANGTATNPISGAIIQDGIYKMNADGSFADEGGFGYGGYTMDDGGHLSTNEMPSLSGFVPWRLRIGGDDRIYMLDYSDEGAIVAFDMQVTTNQVVIDDGGVDGGALGGPHNYAGNPDLSDLFYGINNFDVTSTGTAEAAVWLCNDDNPNWGIWMYHMRNGASVTNDNGTQAVTTGGDLSSVSSGGCTVDTALDIFCGQTLNGENAVYDAMVFTNWNLGILPPTNGGFNYALGANPGEVKWGYGCGVDTVCTNDPTFEALQDVVINSRTSPTIVACPMGAGNDDTHGSGIRLLNAINGSVITVTSGSSVVIQTLTNLDFNQQYTCAAWDNLGNLYGASSTRNVWRAWSPPGPNTSTTVAVPQVTIGQIQTSFKIASITAVRTSSGCATVTITFTGPSSLPVGESYKLAGSSTLNGTYTAVTDAVISAVGSSGTFQATFSNCSTGFYRIEQAGE